MGWADPARGDDGGARQPRARGQGALRRLLEFLRLARDEGDGDCASRGRVPFVSQQIHYTLEAREAEYELIPLALDQKLGVLVWSPLAGGLLSGKYRRATPRRRARARPAGWSEPPIADEEQAVGHRRRARRGRRARAACRPRRSRSPGCSGGPAVTSLIIGGRTEAQFKDNLAAADLKLTAEERARLDKVEPADAPLSLLASGLDGEGPARRRGSGADAPF